jgi:Tfp pilus assembly protein PilN
MLRFPINLSSRPFLNRRKFFLIVGFLLLLLTLFTGWNISTYRLVLARRAAYDLKRAESRDYLAKLNAEEKNLRQQLQKRETADFLEKVEFINSLIDLRTFSWTQLLNDLETLTPANVYIASIRPKIQGREVVVEILANAKTNQDAIDFVAKLESSDRFLEVHPVFEDIAKSPTLVGKQIAVMATYKQHF